LGLAPADEFGYKKTDAVGVETRLVEEHSGMAKKTIKKSAAKKVVAKKIVAKKAAKKAPVKKVVVKKAAAKKVAVKKAISKKAITKKLGPKTTAPQSAAKPSAAASTTSMALSVGDIAPNIELLNDAGETFKLSEQAGKYVVVYFYPKADTPGCTVEACSFRDANTELQEKGIVVVGLSPDPVKALAKFRDKFQLNFRLLADEQHQVAEAYGTWVEKSMYGKKYMGMARSTFIIGKDGKVAKIYPKVTPDGHASEVLRDIAAM
jgi:thioredoxin-dependent peroxiredoxin